MIAAYVIEMLKLQDRLNQEVHPEWLKQDFDWSRAIYVESVELLDHIGWKWWKKQKPDYTQARLELVDIWHFIMSLYLVRHEGNVQKTTLTLMEEWEPPLDKISVGIDDGKPIPISKLDLQRQIEIFGTMAGLTGVVILPLFRLLCERLRLPHSRLYQTYVTKNVLNLFRQANGYKSGTYIKNWFGQEDNQVLADIVSEVGSHDPQRLMRELQRRYDKVVAAAS